jgi:integrase
MPKKKSKSYQVLPNMQIYLRSDSPRYYGCLRIDGKYFRKCLYTENKSEAERKLFEWKGEMLSSVDSPLGETGNSFSAHASRLIQKEKKLPPRPSGIEQWTDTNRLLRRTNGLLDYFGNRDVNTITVNDIDRFFEQLPLNNKPLTTSYINKHKNLLKRILDSANRTDIVYPKFRGKKSEPRGYFNYEEYKTLLSEIKKLNGVSYTAHNGSEYLITEEMLHFVIFMVGSMLRPTVSEVYSLRYEDIEVKKLKDKEYLEFAINRKNRKMIVQTLPTSFYAFRDMKILRPDHKESDYLFAPQYEDRRTAMRYMSNMFAQILRESKMKKGRLGEERTLYSLRHTSLIFNLSQPNVDLLDIARRADTSMKMIQDYYYPQSQLDEKLSDFLRV